VAERTRRTLDARWGNGFFNDFRGHYFEDLSPESVRILIERVQ